MMAPKIKESYCTQILKSSRQLFLSSRISEVCQEKGTRKQLEFVLELMNEELQLREKNKRERLIKRAGFPTYKTFEGYSYQSIKFPPAFSRGELESVEFVPGQKNLVLYGPVGIGKTHMAIAAGVKACNLGYKTKFYTVTELVLKLGEARRSGILERLLRELRALDLLILDEWGYVPVDKDGSQLLFRVIADSYESKSRENPLPKTGNLNGFFTEKLLTKNKIEVFGNEHEEFLRQYLELPGGIPSHDTIQRVIAMVSPEFLVGFQRMWNEMLTSNEGEKIQKILSIDGKRQCGNGNRNHKANHIVSAVDEKGFCLG